MFGRLLLLVLSTFSLAAHAAAEPDKLVNIRLVPERGQIAAGEEITIAIEQNIAPGWHTYWKNPGDSGSAPRVTWALPEGFTTGDIEWPAPHRLPYGPLMNYGYEGQAILLQTLKAPDPLPQGPITLTADIEILVCKEECIPEYGTYSLMLNGPEAQIENHASFIEAARAKLPHPTTWSISYAIDDKNLRLSIPESDLQSSGINSNSIDLSKVVFIPEPWGIVENAPPQNSEYTDGLVITQMLGQREITAINQLDGVLHITADGASKAFAISAKPEGVSLVGAGSIPNGMDKNSDGFSGWLQAIFLALAGGVILNLMPCVFPVLSLKALSLVKISEKSVSAARPHGIAYTAGIVLSFLLIAGLLLGLQAAGSQIGWGFQLQNPLVVALLAQLLFLIGLNLSGGFEIRAGALASFGGKWAQGQGYGASFFAGVLATIVATPCTAPFMAAAIGYALIQPPIVALSIFAALGVGLALPYLALSFLPNLQRIMPRPGAWMETFKQFLAFPMFASSVWLVWVLSQQAGPSGVLGVLAGMVALGFAIWLWRHRIQGTRLSFIRTGMILISILIALALLPTRPAPVSSGAAAQDESMMFGEVFSQEKLETLLQGKEPVFVEMTAAWCITCKLNHATSLNIDSTKALFAQKNVRYLIGDWTNQDPVITKFLQSYGRSGVPVYVYYGPPDATGQRPEPQLLPQILTPAIVAEFINK
jgi:thiol:disulfide interchange protein/DsbC/DsbD-like thiol-disulfide interchange protein